MADSLQDCMAKYFTPDFIGSLKTELLQLVLERCFVMQERQRIDGLLSLLQQSERLGFHSFFVPNAVLKMRIREKVKPTTKRD